MGNNALVTAPQVLLLGNGLNRAYDNSVNWKELIGSIWTNPKIKIDNVDKAPFPLQAVLATCDSVDLELKEKPDPFFGIVNIEEMGEPIEKLLGIDFDHILTTNYSYEIERIACPSVSRDGKYCARLVEHTDGCKRAERKYLLHTYNKIDRNNRVCKIWHIHGEIRKPQSVVLGHYYYGNLLGKYMNELAKRRNRQATLQKQGFPPLVESWIDAFIMGDVYVLGFGFDFSEMDMWWLLNRKKREKANHGNVIFYEPSYGNEVKQSLLDAYDVQVENLGYRTENPNYREFYNDAICDILKRVKAIRAED